MIRHVAFFVFPDFQLLDLSGPLAAFQVAGQASAGAYSVSVMSEEGGRGGELIRYRSDDPEGV
jgi:transcriptional regulator GlxA family with amidase domain